MKIYESVYTYLPLLYLYVVVTAIASLYHRFDVNHDYGLRPYTLLVCLIVNTLLHNANETKVLAPKVIHRHIWRSVTYSVLALLMNIAHELAFQGHHLVEHKNGVYVSVLYVALVLIFTNGLKSDKALVLVNIVFLFVPILEHWQVNLYGFVIFITLSIIITNSRINPKDLVDTRHQIRPALKYYVYLRCDDALVWVGIIQLMFDYRNRYQREIEAAAIVDEVVDTEADAILDEPTYNKTLNDAARKALEVERSIDDVDEYMAEIAPFM